MNTFFCKLNFIAFTLLVFSLVQATELGVSKSSGDPSASPARQLPKCVNDEQTLGAIQTKLAANKKTKFKYDGFRQALVESSDLELQARLVYSETLAANCQTEQSEIMPIIAAVIANRIRLRKGDVKSVVFEKDQFASSLNDYSESRYRDFLCPNDEVLWSKATALVRSNSSILSPVAVHYFLYKHHVGWDKEPWAYPESSNYGSVATRQCVRVFDNPKWK